jgi:hypothetical protein
VKTWKAHAIYRTSGQISPDAWENYSVVIDATDETSVGEIRRELLRREPTIRSKSLNLELVFDAVEG